MKRRKINSKDVMLGLIAQALISGSLDLLGVLSLSGRQQIGTAALLTLTYFLMVKYQKK